MSNPRLSTPRKNFQFLQGQGKTIIITLSEPPPADDNGLAQPRLDLTGQLIKWRWRKGTVDGKDNDLAEIVFDISSDIASEVLILDQTVEATKGQVKLFMKTALTKFLRPGCYNHRIVMVDSLGEETPLLVGEIYIEASA